MVAELTLVRMCDPALDTSAEGLLARVERLEDAVAAGVPASKPTSQPLPPADPVPQPPVPEAPPAAAAATPTPAKKAAPSPAPAPSTPAVSPTTGRVLHRIRGYMNCIERIRRENTMLASFIDGKAFLDESGRVILQLTNSFALTMIDNPKNKETICRAIAPEIKKSISPNDVIFETPEETAAVTDTVLDDLLDAAGEQIN